MKKGTIYASVALQFGADMTQSFDTLVEDAGRPDGQSARSLTVPQKIITAAELRDEHDGSARDERGGGPCSGRGHRPRRRLRRVRVATRPGSAP